MGINAADDIAAFLATGMPAVTVYVGQVPPSPGACVGCMISPDSIGPMQGLGGHQGWDQPSVQVIARGAPGPGSYVEANVLIRAVYALINAQQAGTFDGVRWLHIESVSMPTELTRDDTQRMRFSLSVRGWRAL